MEAIVLACFAFTAYTYFGYPILLKLLLKGRRTGDGSAHPFVSVVIAAFNEAEGIATTVRTLLESDYPANALEVIVVSDASTDGTDEVVGSFASERVRLVRQESRQGQTAGLRRGVAEARGEIVIAADASGWFQPQTVRCFARHFADPKVGAVSGYKAIRDAGTAVAKGDGLYARYDMRLRFWESECGSSWVGLEGGAFAIRKALFRIDFPLDVAADNALCYELYERGFLHRFDPEAVILEAPSQDFRNEFRRKVRIIVLQLHGVFIFRRLFVPWRHPMFVFQNASHKLFRWLVPFALLTQWAASGWSAAPWARAFFVLQCAFYAAAVAGLWYGRRRKAPWFLAIPAYFTTVNLSGLVAWFSLFKNYTLWTPPTRAN